MDKLQRCMIYRHKWKCYPWTVLDCNKVSIHIILFILHICQYGVVLFFIRVMAAETEKRTVYNDDNIDAYKQQQ